MTIWDYIKEENVEEVTRFLEEGGNPEEKKRNNFTLLMQAVCTDCLEITKRLVEAGAIVNSKDNLQQSPILFASYRGNAETTNYLIEQGADVNVEDRYGVTPLMDAFSKGHFSVAKLLSKNKAIFKGREIHHALEKRRYDLILLCAMNKGLIAKDPMTEEPRTEEPRTIAIKLKAKFKKYVA